MDTQQMNENLGVLAESKEVVGIGDAINASKSIVDFSFKWSP